MDKYAVGIDVGMDGAVGLASSAGFADVWDAPTLEVEKPRDRKSKSRTMRVYDKAEMFRTLQWAASMVKQRGGELVCGVIEKVHAMPDQGATSMFTFGRGSGLWEMAVVAMGWACLMPSPQSWKKVVMRDAPKTKEAAVAMAGQLYPHAAKLFRGPNGGLKPDRAEAVLLARYGLFTHSLSTPSQQVDE